MKPDDHHDSLCPFKKKSAKKGTILLHKGNRAKEAYQVVKGCLRSYAIDQNGKEHILQFAPEGWHISDLDSFVNDVEATIYIDAVEDSEILVLNKAMLATMNELPADLLLKQVKIGQNDIITFNKRLILLLSAKAEDRYTDFIETYPSLLQRLPLKMIASYLGMTPEFLSRLRKKMSRK